MAVAIRIVNLEEKFRNSSTDPIIVNRFDVTSTIDKDRLNKLIYTRYDGDSLSILPSCGCGMTDGKYNLNIRCQYCGTPVTAVTERPLESALWLEPPTGVSTFITPEIWHILSEQLTYGTVNLLEWLCNPNSQLPPNPPQEARRLRGLNIERGINYFHEHFDEIVEILARNRLWDKNLHKQRTILEFIRQNRDRIFTRHLPIPSKLGFITEKTPTRTVVDPTMIDAIDAIRTISASEFSPSPLSPKVLQARAVRANELLSRYHQKFLEDSLGKKTGWLRQHIFGGRLHFTFRAVITSLSDRHWYRELHLPWSMAVMAYQTHLTNKLFKLGFTPPETMKYLREHTMQYSELIDQLFQELIAESPDGRGLPVIFNRNPTLVRGSIQTLFVTHIKPNPNVHTISMSVLVLKAPNADFDGDALNGMLILDNRMRVKLESHAPSKGVCDLNKPRTLSNVITIAAPVISTIANYVHQQ